MKTAVILGATRPGRVSEGIAKWVVEGVNATEGLEAELLDLKDYPLPFFDEPISPRYNPDRNPNEAVKKWIEKIAEFDGYIFVTPEYNHSITGVLKNAIDYLTFEMTHKPASVVSHGTVGGARAAEHLKVVLLESQAAVTPQAVAISGRGTINEQGELSAEHKANPYGPQAALTSMLQDFAWYAAALKTAREK